MIQLYRFHMKDGTQKEATGSSEKEAADKLGINPKLYEYHEVLPGKSLTAGQVEDVNEGVSSNGRTTGFEPANTGSTPVTPAKTRKPRADKGQPRGTDKPKRNRGQYFVFDPTSKDPHIEDFATRRELDAYLDTVNQGAVTRVIQGRELRFARTVTFTLKPAK